MGHVEKRMSSVFRKFKSSRGTSKLLDGKTVGGRGRLTAERIEKLHVYCGLAIRRNKDNVEGMRKEIWAGLKHSASSDEQPQHQDCPGKEDTWYKFKKAQRNGKVYGHKNPLPEAIITEIERMYERLSKQDLLEGCLGGDTQNNCESLNHLIWARYPKTIASGRDTLAAAGAVLGFNDGTITISSILESFGIEPGHNTMSALSKFDKNRIRQSKQRSNRGA